MSDAEFKAMLDQSLAVFAGQMNQRFDELESRLDGKMDNRFDQVMTAVDGIAKRLDVDDSERAALESQVERHDFWIKQLAESTHTELIPGR